MRRSSVGWFFMAVVATAGLIACQAPPTKVYETKENRRKDTQETVSAKTVLIDARPQFLWSLAHPSGALNLRWEDFSQREPPFEGRLEKDLFFHARRLARLGIGPDSDILVLGRGAKGEGEEGRLAWTLRRMGLHHVRFAALDSLSWPRTTDEAPPRAEEPIWKPEPDESLEISRESAMERIRTGSPAPWVLDVRSSPEYLKDADPFARMNIHPRLINVPWTDFLNERGAPRPEVKTELQSVGITPQDVILVLDERGVRSAGTTLLLRELGYEKSANWAGGYRELRWFSRKR